MKCFAGGGPLLILIRKGWESGSVRERHRPAGSTDPGWTKCAGYQSLQHCQITTFLATKSFTWAGILPPRETQVAVRPSPTLQKLRWTNRELFQISDFGSSFSGNHQMPFILQFGQAGQKELFKTTISGWFQTRPAFVLLLVSFCYHLFNFLYLSHFCYFFCSVAIDYTLSASIPFCYHLSQFLIFSFNYIL